MNKSFKDYYQYYILVITVIIITIFIQTVTQYSLKKQAHSAALINISGKQRMLSQKILANFYEYRYLKGDYSELKVPLEGLYRTNKYLQVGNAKIGLDPMQDEEVLSMFANLEVHLNYIHSHLIDSKKINQVDVSAMESEVNNFLKLMDEIVNVLQRKAEEEVRTLMIIELELAFLSILIILLEIFFIINPAVKKITTQNKKLSEISWHQTHAFNSHIKNLKDLQLVMKIEKRMNHKEELFDCVMDELKALEEVSSNMVKSLENKK